MVLLLQYFFQRTLTKESATVALLLFCGKVAVAVAGVVEAAADGSFFLLCGPPTFLYTPESREELCIYIHCLYFSASVNQQVIKVCT